ncbi:MAG: hypothetical protein IKZ09_12995 [Clostridia bacterium]|nr:hypothetical protein [Clostridia bacterium]
MENNYPAKLIRVITIGVLCMFCVICTVFIPNFVDYAIEMDYIGVENRMWFIAAAVLLVAPCAAILIMALKLSKSGEDPIFTEDTAVLLYRISIILAIDCGAFAAVTVILFCLGDTLVAPLFALIDLIGLTLSFMFGQLSGYIHRAAEMKEEVDATL